MKMENEEEFSFNDILDRDLANIIAKSAAGAPLNSRERKLIEEELEKRKKPAKAAKSEKIVAPREKAVRSSGYLEEYSHYAELYGVSLRTPKRWSAVGKERGDFCPLDNPEDFYAWWGRNVEKSPPEGLQRALVAWRKAGKGSSKKKTEAIPEDSEPDEVEIDEAAAVAVEELGLEMMLRRLETIEVQLSRKATAPGGSKPWLDTVSRITSVISRLREEKEKHGRLIPKDMAEMMIHEFHGPVESGVRGMGYDFCRDAGLPWSAKEEAAWGVCCDAIFRRFGEEVFRGV